MPPVEQDALIYGPIRVELLTHKVLAQGKFVHLAKMEYRLLCYLILHEGQVLSRQEILTNIWNLPPNVKTRTLDAIYFEQRSVAEVARQKHKTRQAINQTKIKALQKIKEAWGKDKNTAI